MLDDADFWEIRKGSLTSKNLRFINGSVKNLDVTEVSGTSVRVNLGGSWGFAYGEDVDVSVLAKRALKIARSLGKGSSAIPDIGSSKGSFKTKTEEIFDPEKAIDAMRRKKLGGDIVSSAFDCTFSNRKIEYTNSHGSKLFQDLTYTSSTASLTAKKGGKVEQFDSRIGGMGGFEIFTSGFNRAVNEAREKVKLLLNAKVPKGGNFTVVCDPVLVDVLVHEAFGHAAEADLVLKGESCLGSMLGERLGSESISVVDDPSIQGLWGSYFFDDEGIRSSPTRILDRGILLGFLHSRETAAAMDTEPTGNARAEGVSATPSVRMSNTNLQPGKSSKRELFEGIKKGFYLCGSAGGQVDTAKGNFQFNSRYGFRIKDGELGEPVKGLSLSGNTLSMLSSIDLVGKNVKEGMPGFCGKFGQMVPVLGFNPEIRLSESVVGGR